MTGVHTSNGPAEEARGKGQELPGRVVLVMQGGGALGAYQGGVYQALHEAGIEPDWVIGTSIGAINGAIIACNETPRRLERLLEFWSRVRSPPVGWGLLPTFLANYATHVMRLTMGVPGFYSPSAMLAWGLQASVGAERAAFYSIEPLKRLLPDLVDFRYLNGGHPRFTLGLVNVQSGEMRYVDSRDTAIMLDHVLGSSAIPPSFPAVRIDGEVYWDGGIYSNTPIEAVFDDSPRRDSVVFAVQVWHMRGPEPESVWGVMSRQKDIAFASRARSHIARQAQLHHLRCVIRQLVNMLPDNQRRTPQVRELARFGCNTFMHIVELNAAPLDDESYTRDVDFSEATVHARWEAGYADTRLILARRPWNNPVDHSLGVAIHASDAESD
jgi:NTE family protein